MNNTLRVCFMSVKACWDYLVNGLIGEIEEKNENFPIIIDNFLISE